MKQRSYIGLVLGLRDGVTFQGAFVEELKASSEDSVDDYFEFCEERGETPDKPFSGKFLVRIDPALHRCQCELSKEGGKSLNGRIASKLD